jgi:hypothetical protein
MPNPSEAASTQTIIDIDRVVQDALVLRTGGLRKLILVNGINFELKSEEEQELIIYSFQNFLNGLNFSVQLLVRSRKINIDQYLAALTVRQQQESMELLKNIIGEYHEFIRSFVQQNAIMEKNFLVVVPYDTVTISQVSKGLFGRLLGWFGRRKTPQQETLAQAETAAATQKTIEQNIKQLDQRVDQVIAGLTQIGLRAVPLNEEELVELFYNIYNPESTEKKL